MKAIDINTGKTINIVGEAEGYYVDDCGKSHAPLTIQWIIEDDEHPD